MPLCEKWRLEQANSSVLIHGTRGNDAVIVLGHVVVVVVICTFSSRRHSCDKAVCSITAVSKVQQRMYILETVVAAGGIVRMEC